MASEEWNTGEAVQHAYTMTEVPFPTEPISQDVMLL